MDKERDSYSAYPVAVNSNLLATEQDILDLARLYSEYFDTQPDTALVLEIPSTLSIPFGARADGSLTDPGVEVEAGMSTDQILAALSFRDGLPVLFNNQKHAKGFSLWTNQELEGNCDLVPLSLHPHQLSGVHSVIRTAFFSNARPWVSAGKLVADEVGLGKTAIAIAAIAFLTHVMALLDAGKPLPPIISKLSTCLVFRCSNYL
jgi:hypothetical protein